MGGQGKRILICDSCDCGALLMSLVHIEQYLNLLKPPGFHMFCLNPPLANIPQGQWFCHNYLFSMGSNFGFDEGKENSLLGFRDHKFWHL